MATIVPQTRDDERVQALADALDAIQEYAAAPDLPQMTTQTTDTDYDGINFELESVRGTSFDEHVHDIIDYLDGFAGKVNVINNLRVDAPHENRYLTVVGLAYSTSHFSPYSLRFKCFADGRVKVELEVRPLGTKHAQDHRDEFTVYEGLAAEFDADAAREQLAAYQPYVASRVEELNRWHGVNPSEARVIALRELGHTHEDITDRIGRVSSSTTRSYVSNFNDHFNEAEGLFVARAGAPKRVLAKAEFDGQAPGHTLTRYVCQGIRDDESDSGDIWLVTIDEQDAGFPEGASFNVESERFPSVAALIQQKYAGQTFEARPVLQSWKKLFNNIDESIVGEDVRDELDAVEVVLV